MGDVRLRKHPWRTTDISSVMRDAGYAVPPFMQELLYSVTQRLDLESVHQLRGLWLETFMV